LVQLKLPYILALIQHTDDILTFDFLISKSSISGNGINHFYFVNFLKNKYNPSWQVPRVTIMTVIVISWTNVVKLTQKGRWRASRNWSSVKSRLTTF